MSVIKQPWDDLPDAPATTAPMAAAPVKQPWDDLPDAPAAIATSVKQPWDDLPDAPPATAVPAEPVPAKQPWDDLPDAPPALAVSAPMAVSAPAKQPWDDLPDATATPQLETNPLRNLPPTVMGDVTRSAISLGTGLASIPVSTAAGVMDIPGIKQALEATEWGSAARQTVGSALDTLNANKAVLSDEIKKQGGISAEIANNLSSMAADTAANLAMLNVSGFVGKSATMKAAMVDAGKMAALAFVQTPGTTTEKLKQAAIMAAFMLTPVPAGMLPKDWQAKAANIAENLALSAVAGNYGKDVPLAQKIPQVVMDTAFGAVVKGKGKTPLTAEVEGKELEQARIRLGELQGRPAEVSANPEAAALEAKRQTEFVPQGTGESRAAEIARQNEAAGISPRTLEEAPLVMEGKPAGQGESLPERNLAAKPANKADLDKLYPGRIELFERPSGETAYLHKDMSPEARKEWLARPESRGDRATQAAGLDTFLSETQPTIKMVTQIQQEAAPFRKIAATSENWQKEFPDRIVQTPIGEVTLGEHQFEKLMQKGRGQYLGLIKPTLENPSMILKDPEGATLFIKAFRQNGSTYFMSVTRSIEGLDVVISNHPKRPKQIVDAIQTGEKLYYSTALKAIAETLPKPPAYSAGARSESEVNIEQPMGDVNRQSEPAVEGPQQAKALITPRNKVELDILYPGRIQLFEHPALRRGGSNDGITYIHKDMTPEMRAEWLARPESRGPRATQAAGLDAFLQERQMTPPSDRNTTASGGGPGFAEGSTGTGKMRGFAKRLSESDMLSSEQAAGVRANPENYYEPQSYKEINDRLGRMTDDELAVARDTPPTTDSQNNVSIMAAGELFNRRLARGQDVQIDLSQMAKNETMYAQLLRQAAEIKSSSPAGQFLMIEKMLERNKRQLTGAQSERFKVLVSEDFRAREVFRAAERMLERDFTDANAKKADEMEDLANRANRRLVAAYRNALPLSVSKILTQALQGNLLTPLSQIRNITGNLFQGIIMANNQMTATALDKVGSLFTGGRRTVLSPTVGTWEGIKGAGRGVKAAGAQFIGRKTANRISGEAMQGFRPLRAAIQTFTGEGMAVTREGKIAKLDRFKKGLEAALGTLPEPMLRMLSFGDLPFMESARARGLSEQGRLRGLKGEALRKFIRFPDIKALEIVDQSAREATFQQENALADVINFGIKKVGEKLGPVGEVAARTVVPYVKAPSNIMTAGLRYALPPLPLYEAMVAAIKGNRREALLKIGQAVTGAEMLLAGYYLFKHGVIMGDPDKDPKRRGLQYGAGAPNSLNLSALARLKRGESTEWWEGDRLISFQYLGFFGFNLTIIANSGEAWERTMDRSDIPLGQRVGDLTSQIALEVLPQTGSAALNLSALKGTSALLDAVGNNQYDRWWNSEFQAVSSIALPNTLATLNRVRQVYMPELRGNGLLESFEGAVKAKLFMTENMPLKRDLFGRPIRITPEGADPWVWNFIDVTKTRQIPADPLIREVYQVYGATRDPAAIPSIPERRIMMPGDPRTRTPPVRRELNVREYERYQELVGQARMNLALNHLFRDNRYQRDTDENKVKMLSHSWQAGAEEGKIRFVQELLGRPIRGTPPPFKEGK